MVDYFSYQPKAAKISIMRLLSIISFLLLAGAVVAKEPSNYQADYAALKKKVPAEKMEAHLAEWRQREPGNPDAYILSANWYFERAMNSVNITTKPPEGKDFELRDSKGKVAGSISAGSPTAANQAADFLRTALEHWPERFDIHCGLAHMMQETSQWDAEIAALRNAATAVKEHRDKLRWCHAEKIAPPVDQFVAEKLHSFAARQYERENDDGIKRMQTIAELLVEVAPNRPEGYNDLAVVKGVSEDWPGMQELLEKAVAIAPQDALVWINLGDNSIRLGRTKRAEEAYQHVLKTTKNNDYQHAARDGL
jgi:tetratricopeptide (TPR) repeat protein